MGSAGESVIVVMDANRSHENLAALNWALENVVRPKDKVLVLGIISQVGKNKKTMTACFPFYYIWERLEFSGQAEMTPKVLEEEIVKKREEYQAALQPYYRQCKRNEVTLEAKLAAGFSPKIITIEEALNTNTRWIVLDSHLKKDRIYIYGHVGCNIAVMKSKTVATIMPSLVVESKDVSRKPAVGSDQLTKAVPPENPQLDLVNATLKESPTSPPNLCWYPFSSRLDFPRKFTVVEIGRITDDFASENILIEEENIQVYQGILMESPILLKCFVGTSSNECFWSELKILAKVRHRNILNLVGYCCTDTSMFLLFDFPCNGSLDKHLGCDELARKLSWKARWNIALGVGNSLRYLQEECLDGPIAHLAISSSRIVLSHNFSPLLTNFCSAKSLNDEGEIGATSYIQGSNRYTTMLEDERPSLDVHAFGVLLLELITGQNALSFDDGQNFVKQVLHFLDGGTLNQLMDQRLIYSNDAKEVQYMYSAALLCVKNDFKYRPCMSEVLSVLRGHRFAASQW